MTPSDLLAVSDERDQWLTRLHAAERAAFARGRAAGRREGYEYAYREMDRRWVEIARPVARGGPMFAELERKRWGPDGREHFADPRPGDFPGRGAATEAA